MGFQLLNCLSNAQNEKNRQEGLHGKFDLGIVQGGRFACSMKVYLDFKRSENALGCLLCAIGYLAANSTNPDFSMDGLLENYLAILCDYLRHPLDTGRLSGSDILGPLDLAKTEGDK